ncbi:MAG: topoisomerase C-terminal repeat-containing protein, partial [Bacteroidota bacterium]
AGLLPPLEKGQPLDLDVMTATQKFSSPPARYTEASLVKKLEELGIGRPSTYAPTISTVQKRGYVIKEDRMGRERSFTVLTLKAGKVSSEVRTETYGSEKAKMFPSDIGTVVTDFLVQHFPVIMDYHFTANVEKDFDEIANGHIEWERMIKKFYGPFHKQVEQTEKHGERATGERVLGNEPKTGLAVIARIGRFGPLVQINGKNEDDKPRYAKLRSGQRLETISLEEALDLFKMPRNLGSYEGEDIVIGIGRFGPYARHGSLFASLSKEDDPYTIELSRAVELVEAKRQAERERMIKVFPTRDDVQVLKGRWGPYLVVEGRNYRIPKDTIPEQLSLEDCLEIAATSKPSGKVRKVKAAGKTQTAPVRKAASRKPAARKSTTAAKKPAAKKTTVKKTTTSKSSTKAPASSTPTKAVKKTATKKAAPKKATAKKATKTARRG